MKKLKIILILFLLLTCRSNLLSSEFKLLINYLEGEHSKDSWTKETTITIDDRAYSYGFTSSGHLKGKDENKNGVLTKEQFDKIKSYILDNNLLVNDSLFDKDEKYKAFERFTNIVITIYQDTSSTTIKMNGDIQNFENKTLYKNSMGLINLVINFIKGE